MFNIPALNHAQRALAVHLGLGAERVKQSQLPRAVTEIGRYRVFEHHGDHYIVANTRELRVASNAVIFHGDVYLVDKLPSGLSAVDTLLFVIEGNFRGQKGTHQVWLDARVLGLALKTKHLDMAARRVKLLKGSIGKVEDRGEALSTLISLVEENLNLAKAA